MYHLLRLAGLRFQFKSRGRIQDQEDKRSIIRINCGVGWAQNKFITGACQLPDNGYISTTATAPPSSSSSVLVTITASICPSRRPRRHSPFRQNLCPKTYPTRPQHQPHSPFKIHAFPLLAKLQACSFAATAINRRLFRHSLAPKHAPYPSMPC